MGTDPTKKPRIHGTDMAAAMEIAARFNPRKAPWIAMVIAKHMQPLRQRVAEVERTPERLLREMRAIAESFSHSPTVGQIALANTFVKYCDTESEALRAHEPAPERGQEEE